jgi:inner membrane protein involved in colicin E2 resistance
MSITKRILAIVVIFIFATIAWAILGATIFARTYGMNETLHSRVGTSWGTAQTQLPPTASFQRTRWETREVEQFNKTITKTVETKETILLPLQSTRANVALFLEHRQKGLLWYATYKVNFQAEYSFRNTSDQDEEVTFSLPLPAEQALYDDLHFELNGAPVATQNEKSSVHAAIHMSPGQTAKLKTAYKSQGLDQWQYQFSQEVAEVRDFDLRMTTNFKEIDFPANTLSPSDKHETGDGWQLEWNYSNLLSGYSIGMVMPEKLQPGPLAGRISFFAPVSLFFFFFLVFIITTLRGIDLHPMNYFFLAAAFFAFHLLMAYLVDHVSIHTAFAAGAAVSLALVISYMRLVAGARFAWIECGLAQLVYLVGFSYAFFFKGFTGLAVTIGSIITLFIVMQMTGRINWSERFAPKPAPVRTS